MEIEMRRRILLLAFLLFIIFTGGTLILREGYRKPDHSETIENTRFLMGTIWTIKVPVQGGLEKGIILEAIDASFEELARIEALMSEWDENTPVSLVNRNAGIQPVSVPGELMKIVERGIEYGHLTGGAFDITWRGMGRLWDFGEEFRIPSSEEIEAAVSKVDYRKVRVGENTLFLPESGMALGLGGIAKGYAIDRAGLKLKEFGIGSFLVDGGGDILTAGEVSGRPWRLGIRDPRGGPADLVRKLSLSGGAVVTSGDYERFRIENGRRYHHIIDPRTGWPAEGCRSVTVYSRTAERADVLATAVFVLGVEPGLELVENCPGTEALVIDSGGDIRMTGGFKSLLDGEPVSGVPVTG